MSGNRNEYLRALVAEFGDAKADSVMMEFNRHAEVFANAAYPEWFYAAVSFLQMVPLVKKNCHQNSEQMEKTLMHDLSVLIGASDCERHLMDSISAEAADYLAPEQLAVGVQNGASIMIHGLRLSLEMRQDFVLIKLDIKNGYDAASSLQASNNFGALRPPSAPRAPTRAAATSPPSSGRLPQRRIAQGEQCRYG